tara:strand:+ start:8 stop:1006 length:999 start_codon:yes stop_codon:yes gene_type:complete
MAKEIYGDKNFQLPDWLIGEKYKEQRQKFDLNEKELDKFKDLNYKPKSIMEQFAENPDYTEQPSLTPLTLPRRDNFDSPMTSDVENILAVAKKNADISRKIKTEAEAKVEKEKFVAKDTLLGRIFDKRVKPGEDISNRDKASAMLRNLSDNLLERRLVGGKEGTDTMSRILGPSGGIREGMTEIEALESAAQAKNLQTILADQKLRKGEADIKKVMADTALQKAGIDTENMDSDTKSAYYQTLAELGESNINTPMFQKKLLENMRRQQSIEALDTIGPEYMKALDALKVEKAGTPAHDNALKMLQLYGQYLPEQDDMAETQTVQSQKELTNS